MRPARSAPKHAHWPSARAKPGSTLRPICSTWPCSNSTPRAGRRRASCRARTDSLELVADLAAALHQLVGGLQPDEEAFRHAEIAREPQIGVRGDGALAKHDFVD